MIPRRALLPTMALALAGVPAVARAEDGVDLELVLAVDASGSVSRERFELQRDGYAAAFRDPRVLRAIAGGPSQAIAVTMMQWTGPTLQIQVVGWTRVGDAASAVAFAEAVATARRQLFGGGTSISGAIDRAMRMFPASRPPGLRRVIDISGDGANNNGRPVAAARDDAVAADVVINGLPILNIEPDLDQHYRSQVIGGPGAFLIAIERYEQFAEAIVRKLVTEIAALPAPDRGFTG